MDQAASGRAENDPGAVARSGGPAPRPVSRFLRVVFNHRKLRLPFFVLGNAAGHLRLVRLMHAAGIRAAPGSPSAASYRYLRAGYLRGGFSLDRCLAISTDHHRHLVQAFSAVVLDQVRACGYALWRQSGGGHLLEVILRQPYYYNFDGDLCLALGLDGRDIYTLSFSMCDGKLIDGGDGQVLLVASIQGQRGKLAEIRQATAACRDVAPPQVLLAAAEALAQAIGIGNIAAAGDAARATGAATRARLDYDTFQRCVTCAGADRRWHVVVLPFEDKPLLTVAAKHRGRARERRAIRDQLRTDLLRQACARLGA